MRWKRAALAAITMIAVAVLAACGSSGGGGGASQSGSASKGTIVVAAPECAHCLAMSLLQGKIPGYNVKFQSFGTLTELTAGLASGKIDVGQIDYTGLVSFIDKNLPIVAISGEVNGGSDFVVSPSVKVAAGDWAGLKTLLDQDKSSGHKFTIASQFGTVQDIELRLELPKYGIDPDNDVNLVNVQYQGMAQALQSGSADAAIPVQPFAASITLGNTGVHFAYPYDQAAGNLTNVVVVNKDFLSKHPDEVAAIASGMNTLVPYLKTPQGQQDWAAAVEKYTGVSADDVNAALTQLTPQIEMPFAQVQAIAAAMFKQNLITTDLSAATLQQHMDYGPLATATGRSQQDLGAPAS
jgi:ABC-type nitrate/sulfonate/bicarbonate transport system substrate-binding protein